MRIALDPYMHRHLSLEELPRKVAELGYEWIELSPRADFLDWWVAPRVYPGAARELQEGAQRPWREDRLAVADVPLGEPARGRATSRRRILEEGDPGRRRHGRRHDELEFGRGPSPARGHSANCCGGRFTAETSEAAWWRSMEELVPIFEREGVQLNIEPHPEDWVETLHPALDMVRVIGSKAVRSSTARPIRSILARTWAR